MTSMHIDTARAGRLAALESLKSRNDTVVSIFHNAFGDPRSGSKLRFVSRRPQRSRENIAA